MRPPIRLFQIIQALRRSRRPVTAEALAAELEVSTRSVYRDIANVIRHGAPIRGEVGVGYVLDRKYDMPPLMFTPAELEAAVLGAQWVTERADRALASAARDQRMLLAGKSTGSRALPVVFEWADLFSPDRIRCSNACVHKRTANPPPDS